MFFWLVTPSGDHERTHEVRRLIRHPPLGGPSPRNRCSSMTPSILSHTPCCMFTGGAGVFEKARELATSIRLSNRGLQGFLERLRFLRFVQNEHGIAPDLRSSLAENPAETSKPKEEPTGLTRSAQATRNCRSQMTSFTPFRTRSKATTVSRLQLSLALDWAGRCQWPPHSRVPPGEWRRSR